MERGDCDGGWWLSVGDMGSGDLPHQGKDGAALRGVCVKPHLFKGGGLWYCTEAINTVGLYYGIGDTPAEAYNYFMFLKSLEQ